MKRLFRIRVFGFLVIALVVAGIALISVNTRGGSGFITSSLNSLVKPLKSMAASVAKSFESLYGYIYEYDTVVAEKEELKAQLAKLQQDYREYTDVSEENDRLRALLDLDSRHPDFKQYDLAAVITWGSSNWLSSFTIGKGSSNSDVKVGDCVITETGALVGVVSVVMPNTSTVITVIDTTFSVGAYIERSEERAIASGDFSLMKQGLLKFDFMLDATEIVAGDTIITSGKNGILPAGLVVGTVREVVTHPTGLGRYATIEPAADLQGLANVIMITSFEVTGEGAQHVQD